MTLQFVIQLIIEMCELAVFYFIKYLTTKMQSLKYRHLQESQSD